MRRIRNMRKVTATELARHARDVIDQVRMTQEPVVVENRGKPMAAVVSFEAYEEFLRYEKQRERRFERLFAAAEANAARNSDLTEDAAMALVDQVRQEIWEEQRRSAAS